MNDGMVRRDSLDRKVDDIEDAAGNKKVCRNDIAYNMMRMWQGAMGVAPEDCLVSPAYVVLAPNKDAAPHFFQYLFKLPAMLQFLTSHSRGLTKDRLRLYFDDFAKMEFRCPTVKEQQRIADFLAAIDEHIATKTERLDSLKTHKKGLMQQLFPCEGESQPRVRFPEFGNDEQWGNVSLGEISEIKLGKMLDKQKNTTGYLLPYLNNISVRWNEVNVLDLPQMYFDDRELERFGLKSGDVVVCEGGEPGRAAVWDGHLPDLKFQKAIHRVRFNVPFEPKILVLLLESISGTPQFEMLFTGGGIKHLTGETFSRLKIPLIPVPEQKRIADCFTSLDTLITAATQELDTLKTHKKALMQQLFPAQEEVAA